MNFVKKILRRFVKKRYKVTRTWYIWASSPTEAISRTQFTSHDQVEAGLDDSDIL
jgi:hypothetical protein